MFRVASDFRAPAFVHTRAFGTREPGSSVESFVEVIGAAAITGAPLHIVHLNSMSLSSTPQTSRWWKARPGLDLTTAPPLQRRDDRDRIGPVRWF
jgi:hypothetical protein